MDHALRRYSVILGHKKTRSFLTWFACVAAEVALRSNLVVDTRSSNVCLRRKEPDLDQDAGGCEHAASHSVIVSGLMALLMSPASRR